MSIQHDEAMYDKGYRYKLIPLNAEFEPLYSKTLGGIGPLIRGLYKDTLFDIRDVLQRGFLQLRCAFHISRGGADQQFSNHTGLV